MVVVVNTYWKAVWIDTWNTSVVSWKSLSVNSVEELSREKKVIKDICCTDIKYFPSYVDKNLKGTVSLILLVLRAFSAILMYINLARPTYFRPNNVFNSVTYSFVVKYTFASLYTLLFTRIVSSYFFKLTFGRTRSYWSDGKWCLFLFLRSRVCRSWRK